MILEFSSRCLLEIIPDLTFKSLMKSGKSWQNYVNW